MTDESDSGVVKRSHSDESDAVADAVRDLATAFAPHPGFMWTESGFEVLHADWPAYPIAHGVRAALYTLADYPTSTEFYSVDNIDACTLFFVNRKLQTSARNPEHLWAAVWDDDLRELSRSGLVDGIANLDDDLLVFPDRFIEVSSAARRLALVYELTAGVHPKILTHVDEFLRSERFDLRFGRLRFSWNRRLELLFSVRNKGRSTNQPRNLSTRSSRISGTGCCSPSRTRVSCR
jgi:hypothetical protein